MSTEPKQGSGSEELTEEGLVHMPGIASRFVRLGSGAKAHYMASGDTGPAVILLHGGAAGASSTLGWRYLPSFLGANGFRVYCPDLPGYGLTDPGPAGQEYSKLGTIGERQFLNDFADALCLDKFFMGGQGTGMELIVQYVMVHPDRVSGMLLIDGRLWGLVDIAKRVVTKDGKWASDPDRRTVPFDGTAKSIENNMLGMTVNPNTVWPALVDMRLKSAALQEESFALRQPANERIANDPNLQQLVSIKGRFDKLTIPAIYLFGLQDNNNPVENGFLQEDLGLENIQFFYLDECGHQAQNDQPEKFGQISLEFFRDGKVSWKTAEWVGASRRTPINSNLVEEPSGGFPSSVPDFYNQFTREAKAAVKA